MWFIYRNALVVELKSVNEINPIFSTTTYLYEYWMQLACWLTLMWKNIFYEGQKKHW
jgi:hypothetical protein